MDHASLKSAIVLREFYLPFFCFTLFLIKSGLNIMDNPAN